MGHAALKPLFELKYGGAKNYKDNASRADVFNSLWNQEMYNMWREWSVDEFGRAYLTIQEQEAERLETGQQYCWSVVTNHFVVDKHGNKDENVIKNAYYDYFNTLDLFNRRYYQIL